VAVTVLVTFLVVFAEQVEAEVDELELEDVMDEVLLLLVLEDDTDELVEDVLETVFELDVLRLLVVELLVLEEDDVADELEVLLTFELDEVVVLTEEVLEVLLTDVLEELVVLDEDELVVLVTFVLEELVLLKHISQRWDNKQLDNGDERNIRRCVIFVLREG